MSKNLTLTTPVYSIDMNDELVLSKEPKSGTRATATREIITLGGLIYTMGK